MITPNSQRSKQKVFAKLGKIIYVVKCRQRKMEPPQKQSQNNCGKIID